MQLLVKFLAITHLLLCALIVFEKNTIDNNNAILIFFITIILEIKHSFYYETKLIRFEL
ncbi:hypothetical protein GCM10011508_20530 [Flavobacterium lutivivi]|nr:hypothetical protein GCM10011508_20530 [Flavobacterium lutivivi]